MKQRIITGAAILLIIAGVIISGKYAFLGLCALLSALSTYEYLKAIGAKKTSYIDILYALILLFLGAFFPELLMGVFTAILMLIIAQAIISAEVTDVIFYRIWGFIYVGLFSGLGISVAFREAGYLLMITAMLSCMICDTAAYFSGYFFGKHKLCPDISPKKTVEGSIGGAIGALLTFILSKLIGIISLSLPLCLLAGIGIGVICQFGDLCASLVKRRFGIKDYGSIFPGHGGALDRVDSELFTFAFMYIFTFFTVK